MLVPFSELDDSITRAPLDSISIVHSSSVGVVLLHVRLLVVADVPAQSDTSLGSSAMKSFVALLYTCVMVIVVSEIVHDDVFVGAVIVISGPGQAKLSPVIFQLSLSIID